MRSMMFGAGLALILASGAAAADYKLEFAANHGRVLKGRGGLQVFDVTTDKTRMRIISPGARITGRGTVRVLIMNLGQPAYEFGPDQVSVELPDGTSLKEVPVSEFDDAEVLVQKQLHIGATVDRNVKASLSAYAQQQTTGATAADVAGHDQQQASRGAGGGNVEISRENVGDNAIRIDRLSDNVPGARLLNGLNGVLRPLAVGPKEAWGGYLVFDMPEALRRGTADQPVVIVVRTGSEVHRIGALLNRM